MCSMREIVHVHIGQAGINTGLALWDLYAAEHASSDHESFLHHSPSSNLDVVFSSSSRRPLARALFIDGESPQYISRILSSSPNRRSMFSQQKNVALGTLSSGGVYPGGKSLCSVHHWDGNRAVDNAAFQKLRLLLEDCDNCQGIILTHSICGGIGSGFAESLITHLREDVEMRVPVVTLSVFPSLSTHLSSGSPIEAYNALMALDALTCSYCNADLIIPFENEILFRRFESPVANFEDINRYIAEVGSALTSGSRFGSGSAFGLSELIDQVVPMGPQIAIPCLLEHQQQQPVLGEEKDFFGSGEEFHLDRVFTDKTSLLCGCDFERGVSVGSALFVRGPRESLTSIRMQEQIARLRQVQKSVHIFSRSLSCVVSPKQFAEVISPPSSRLLPTSTTTTSIIGLQNSTAIRFGLLERLAARIRRISRFRPFTSWFCGAGVRSREIIRDPSWRMWALMEAYERIEKGGLDEENSAEFRRRAQENRGRACLHEEEITDEEEEGFGDDEEF